MRRHIRDACKLGTPARRQKAQDAQTIQDLKRTIAELSARADLKSNITQSPLHAQSIQISPTMTTNITNNINIGRVEASFMSGVAAQLPRAEDIKADHVTADYLRELLPTDPDPADLIKHAANLVLQTFRSMYGESVKIADMGIMRDNTDVKRVYVSQGRGAWESQFFLFTLSDWLTGALRCKIRALRTHYEMPEGGSLSIEQTKIVEMAQNAGFIRVLHDESAFRRHVVPETPELILSKTVNRLLKSD